MNAKTFCLLVGAALAWTPTVGCADVSAAKKETSPNRWIGLLEDGNSTCPDVDGWRAQKLLSESSRQHAQDPPDELFKKFGLNRFCVYTKKNPSSKPFPEALPGLIKQEPDRIEVVLLSGNQGCSSGDLAQRIRPNLEEQFLQQTGQVKLTESKHPSVRLVFVDTQETFDGLPKKVSPSCHGYALAHMAYRLVCGGGEPCPIKIATRLALRFDSTDPDSASDEGGRLGSLHDLAEAITEEVSEWQKDKRSTRLILNLSIGWDGELLSEVTEDESKLGPAALEVYNAIRYAAGHGALVIAAAGNRRGGTPDTRWPVLPAAWEVRRLLERKAIYAVGGLDWQGMPISNSRHGGMPQRAAYADHVAVRTRSSLSTEWTSIYTGTSVSAAVVSSVAATAWYLQPTLSPFEVMERIDQFGEVLPLRADFHEGLTQPPVRRVSLCQTVKEICRPDGTPCRPAVRDLLCPAWDHHPPDLSLLGLRPRIGRSPNPTSPLALFRDLNTPASGWTGPQPGDNPCSSCTILPDPPPRATATDPITYSLALDTSPSFVSTIESAVLVIDCGASHYPIALDPPFSSSTRIPLDEITFTPSNCTSSVDWLVKAGGELRSVQSPVLIYP
jgi:hypothetical protein